ncbi:NADP-dependent 3-hydroxy acid dehydrogenase YdfG [Tenacibaculum adriaticum]|uniref:NADP-dependent 3-hydroxy acid dehydrogenase YdfG n=1 Tax=Tenacibaculum adriaticum TaxID=413713 RepID=A0A5S5DTX6_9FLAO|nr:SDR family oxidoreductase [Tenacibaculum adriaticum]TYP99225.1 NADP-dependent 3-hydroxy acid dehydrogenase YdfG [Tenacibaculum adriaticum]
MDTKKVWLVTGASKGLGLSLVKKLLEKGYKVAATSRNVNDLKEAVGVESSNFLPLQVDLVSNQSVADAIANIIKSFGVIDVIVNNAGYGQAGTLEELSDEESRKNFDVNVFGALNVIRKVMPHLRAKKSGHIFNISSVAGFIGNFPSFGIYCASKYAVVGFTEALSAEAKDFGIKATVVYPGYFRTNFLDEGSFNLPKNPISDYADARAIEKLHTDEIRGNQAGDPEKAANVLIKIAKTKNPPLHLFLGSDAYQYAKQKLEIIENEMTVNEALATSTDY